ncbi:MAG: hypothetical protein CMP20_04165 [Rickettsiales bacterium]|nr:hypothetical protein [Rickettsiales bacterium]
MLVFHTPTLIPIEGFTTFGLNAKPNVKTPIGFFGTGLKYAVAITLRLGGTFYLYIGSGLYEFYISKGEFRGKEFSFVRMRKQTRLGKWGRSVKLPFTLELGKNWEPWMAVRELESNTRDENGTSCVTVDGMDRVTDHYVSSKSTTILIDCPDMEDAYDDGSIFLETEGRKPLETESKYVEIYEGESPYVYMNGIRVFTPNKPCAMTYNITQPLELTEDRTPKHTFITNYYILDALRRMNNEKALKSLFKLEDGKRFETSLDFDDEASERPSSTFVSVLSETIDGGEGVFSRAATYHKESGKINMDASQSVVLTVQDWVDIANSRQISEVHREAIVQKLEEKYDDLTSIGLVLR